MKMERVMIQLPKGIKAKLDALRARGTTVSGYIRSLLEQHFASAKRKGRQTT